MDPASRHGRAGTPSHGGHALEHSLVGTGSGGPVCTAMLVLVAPPYGPGDLAVKTDDRDVLGDALHEKVGQSIPGIGLA
jgi:hypothetical protein